MSRRLTACLLVVFVAATNAAHAQEAPPAPPPPALVELPYAPPGLFANLGVDVVRPRLRDYGAPLDSLRLDLAVSPRATLGVGLGGGMALLANYRYLYSTAETYSFEYAPGTPAIEVHPLLKLQTLDFDLLGREFDYLGLVRTQWQAGVRLAKVDMETYSFPLPGMHYRDEWTGVGGHLGPRLSVVLGNTGLAVYGLGDLGLAWGNNSFDTWRFEPGHGPTSGNPRLIPSVDSESLGSLQLRGELGASWTCCLEHLRLRLASGYAVEWWYFPGLSNAGGSYFDSPGTGIPFQGVFVRLEVLF